MLRSEEGISTLLGQHSQVSYRHYSPVLPVYAIGNFYEVNTAQPHSQQAMCAPASYSSRERKCSCTEQLPSNLSDDKGPCLSNISDLSRRTAVPSTIALTKICHIEIPIKHGCFMVEGTVCLMVKTCSPDLELQGLSPTSVRGFFFFPLYDHRALKFTQLYCIQSGCVSPHPSEGM